jgi:hemerythrin
MDYDDLKKIIESCHLNFLIGSGASRPFLGTLGTIETMLTELAQKDDSDTKKIVEASIKKHYFDIAIKGNLDLSTATSGKFKNTKSNYNEFLNALNTILVKRKSNLVSKQVNLFTTNMDLFLETCSEELGFNYNDGFSGRINPKFGTENFHNSIRKTSTHYEYQSEIPLFNIFKLHGSLNWKQNADTIVYDSNLSILNEIDNIIPKKGNFIEIEKDDGSGNWSTKTIDEIYDEVNKAGMKLKLQHKRFIRAYSKLVMINPTKDKFETTTRNLMFYELLRMYSNHLERENSILFVFGFSFADEHITEITKRVASANPTLLIYIFAFDKESIDFISSQLPTKSNIRIIGDETDAKKYSLEIINNECFKELAEELKDN